MCPDDRDKLVKGHQVGVRVGRGEGMDVVVGEGLVDAAVAFRFFQAMAV